MYTYIGWHMNEIDIYKKYARIMLTAGRSRLTA